MAEVLEQRGGCAALLFGPDAPVEIAEFMGGCRLVATRAIAKGDRIFCGKPFACIVLPEKARKHCSVCVDSEPTILCDCGAHFCSEACRDLDPSHEEFCRARQRVLRNRKLVPFERELGLMLLAMLARGQEEGFERLHCLELDGEYDAEGLDDTYAVRDFMRAQAATCVQGAFAGSDLLRKSGLKHKDLVHMLRRVARNSFRSTRRHAVYSDVSMMNHSCFPSAAVENEGPNQAVFALRDLAAGEEVSISYVDVHTEKDQRQRELAHWGFECQCDRCLDLVSQDVWDSFFEDHVCKECGAVGVAASVGCCDL